MKIWTCKIGEIESVPHGADSPMRKAVFKAYKEITGHEPEFIFSGWVGELDAIERSIVEEEYAKKQPAEPKGNV
jgi:hypothetical protein